MFEDALELWKHYLSLKAPSWPEDDPRQGLSAEVRERLQQLDIILEYLDLAITVVQGDPVENRRSMEETFQNVSLVDSGQITPEEFMQRQVAASTQRGKEWVRSWEEVRLFTETFYFVAWRLVQVVRARGPFSFPGVNGIRARGVSRVRNQLLQHPEHRGETGNFQQWLTLTADGPVLMSNTMIVRSHTGRVDPDDESRDRGLFLNADELRDELAAALKAALKDR